MIIDNRTNALEERIALIEKDIEEENERANTNRMKARFFMCFLLIGADEGVRAMLERKVRDLLRNPDACEFIHIESDTDVNNSAAIGEQIEKVLLNSANRHIDVQNLNTLFICPVIFSENKPSLSISKVLTDIDTYISHSGRTPIWQPFAVIKRNVSQYENISATVNVIRDFVNENVGDSINRCCLLSDQDGNGFTVPKENIMQTIAMTVVLQNVETQNAGAAQSILSRVKISSNAHGAEDIFFTARNAAVTNPIRSLTLQRVASAVDFFATKGDNPAEAALGRINYSFISQIMRPFLAKLPQSGGMITFFPIYSVIDGQNLRGRLQEIINKFYFEPMQGGGAKKAQLDKAVEVFLVRFFEAGGSLKSLKDLITDKNLENEFLQYAKNCFDNIPIEAPLSDKKKLQSFNEGIYAEARRYCEDLVRRSGLGLLESLSEALTEGTMLSAINKAEHELSRIKEAIGERLRKLRDVETLLVLDRTVQRTDIDEVQKGWIADRAMDDPAAFAAFSRNFDALVYGILQKNAGDLGDILGVCYSAVKGSGYSNDEYLKRLSDECAVNEDRAKEFANIVEKNWCYTLRFLKHDEESDITCIIGDPSNRFCDVLIDRFKASQFAFSGFDRIDVLHISAPFAPSNMWEWKQIAQN